MPFADTKRDERTLQNYIAEIRKQSIHPPEKDIVIKSFYQAFLLLLKDPPIINFLNDILAKRNFTSSHFVNLFFRTIQYIELFHLKNDKYPSSYTNVKAWKKELKFIFNNYEQLVRDILLTRDTTTTIYQRYAGSKAILKAIFGKKRLAVADFGCGGNYGLPGLAKNLTFKDLVDHTRGNLVTKLINQNIIIKSGIAIDKEAPSDPESKAWRIACSFYPKELDKSVDMLILEAEVSNVKSVHFVKMNLIRANYEHKSIHRTRLDGIIMSTFLYQLDYLSQVYVFNLAKKLLKKNGIIIIQDFAEKKKGDKKGLKVINNWFYKPYLYRTFIVGKATNWEIKEILKWKNGRCREVRPGKDFNFIVDYLK